MVIVKEYTITTLTSTTGVNEMKAYLDALTAVNVLTAKESEWNEEVTYYHINNGFQITVVKDGKEYPVDEFEFDSEINEVTVRTKTAVDNGEWDGEWYLEFDDITPDQLIIEKVIRVTLEELTTRVNINRLKDDYHYLLARYPL
jgi:hypothetical protein